MDTEIIVAIIGAVGAILAGVIPTLLILRDKAERPVEGTLATPTQANAPATSQQEPTPPLPPESEQRNGGGEAMPTADRLREARRKNGQAMILQAGMMSLAAVMFVTLASFSLWRWNGELSASHDWFQIILLDGLIFIVVFVYLGVMTADRQSDVARLLRNEDPVHRSHTTHGSDTTTATPR